MTVISGLAASLPGFFGLTGVTATKERGYYRCDMADGSVKIFKSSDGLREIRSRYKMLKSLAYAGFPYTDQILEAASGVPYVNLGRETFVMTRHIPGRDLDLNNQDDISLAMKNLACFHLAARNLKELELPHSPPLSETFQKQSNALALAVKQVNRRPRMSDFDVLLIKHAPVYSERAANAAAELEATDYAALHALACENKQICHNDIKEESLQVFNETCYILNFSEAVTDLQLADLAAFIRRYARRSQREIPAARLVELYDRYAPLPSSAVRILHAQLLFPWPFMKIITHYYSKKRNWTPAAITSRITGILDEQAGYDEYIGELGRL